MGPLANPAHVQRQLVGIARPAYVPIYAEAFEALGTQRSFIVSGDEGLDELSLAGGNECAEVQGRTIAMHRVSAADAGLPVHPVTSLRGGDAAYNADALRRLLMGEEGPIAMPCCSTPLPRCGSLARWTTGAKASRKPPR
jgi:anthranilate phosphoribosyltransferase